MTLALDGGNKNFQLYTKCSSVSERYKEHFGSLKLYQLDSTFLESNHTLSIELYISCMDMIKALN